MTRTENSDKLKKGQTHRQHFEQEIVITMLKWFSVKLKDVTEESTLDNH